MFKRRFASALSLLCLLFVVLTPALPPTSVIAKGSTLQGTHQVGRLYRTLVTFRTLADRTRLNTLNITMVRDTAKGALVVVDEAQLETLARLRFQPRTTEALDTLATRGSPWLRRSLRPLLALAANIATQRTEGAARAKNLRTLHKAVATLTAEQRAGIAAMSNVDDDGDGLTNIEEGWWCTNPNNPNTDGDAQGHSDGKEVTALLDPTVPRTIRWGYGPPFGPPNAWPDWNGQDGNTTTPACNDGDFDTIPDFAEAYIVGSDVPNESTDNDKFDDGQEFFGVTYCPGGSSSCGYGSYPKPEYWNFIKATMPNWVLPPGDNLFVAAFPVPEVSVVPGSWTVDPVTTITTQEGTMREDAVTYATTVTRGQSSSIANTKTWNEWEEVSEAIERPFSGASAAMRLSTTNEAGWTWENTARMGGGVALATAGGLVTHAALAGGATACVISVWCLGAFTVGTAVVMGGEYIFGDALDDTFNKDTAQVEKGIGKYPPLSTPAGGLYSIEPNQNIDTQGIVNSLDGVQYALNQQSALIGRGLHDISYAISQPRLTETRTNGRSWGGAQTTTHEEYEEHAISNGQAFTTGQSWSTAWAVDSSRAAELTFDFTVKNTGTEYAKELKGVIFNVYLGDDSTPLVSYPAWQKFPNGTLENRFPGDSNTFASDPVPLSLEQMKRIDLGEQLRVVLEDMSFGADENFYKDAMSGGVTVYIEDGVDDGDELVDSYVIPTWGEESVQDVLARYFPAGYDEEGNINALWTPEYNGTNPPTWKEHFLSDIAWWNIYLSQANAGDTPLKDLQAQAESALLFRFNRDSDRDGYNDRVEMQYRTDKNNPASHPRPEVLAGYVASRTGNDVTVTVALENRGTFDAYGIDAVMYAPDTTTTVTNNTIGGNGRARPGQHVAVGSMVKPPVLASWGSSTAKPYAGGNYAGIADRTYTFRVTTQGVIGQGSTAMSWDDGAGGSGSLALGSTYRAPLPLAVAQGLEIGFNSGSIAAGASFTVQALTPRDTFKYTINASSFTPPVIVVSYSDPQGSHRFITPVQLSSLDSSLASSTGQMLKGLKLDIVTTASVNATGNNRTNFVFNSPHTSTIKDAWLRLNFVKNGQLVKELSYKTTLSTGPTVFPVTWSPSIFSQAYDPAADNILVAFWTDARGNIIDSAARPLNTFAADPSPAFNSASPDATWSFGTITRGDVLDRSFTFGNTGTVDLLMYMPTVSGVSVSGSLARRVAPGDTTTYAAKFNASNLAIGPYDRTITIRTNDAVKPTRTIQITGTIAALTDGAFARPVASRPWHRDVWVPGNHQQNETIDFAHRITTAPAGVEPLYVYNQTRTTLLGTGDQLPAGLSGGALSSAIFGDGRDGDLTIASGTTLTACDDARFRCAPLANTLSTGERSLSIANADQNFAAGQEVLLIQMQGEGAGTYDFRTIQYVTPGNIVVTQPLTRTYAVGGNSKAQVLRVPHFRNTTVNTGGTLTAKAWDGYTGGVLVMRVAGTVSLHGGTINGTGLGFTGGIPAVPSQRQGQQGEGIAGSGVSLQASNVNGGGGGKPDTNANDGGGGGGGGSHSSHGEDGRHHGGGRNDGPGYGATYIYGSPALTRLYFGGGGGSGGGDDGCYSGAGGAGGAVIGIWARTLDNNGGFIHANGNVGGDGGGPCGGGGWNGGGGGGAGGSILLVSRHLTVGDGLLTTVGGLGGLQGVTTNRGGNGGVGRIRIEYQTINSGWSTTPAASTNQVNFFAIEKISDTHVRYTLPETFTGNRIYSMQFGQRHVYEQAGDHLFSVQLIKGRYTSVTLDALLARADTSAYNLCLDIGNDGTCDWTAIGPGTLPRIQATSNLAKPLNTYLSRATPAADGTVVVPIRARFNTAGEVFLTNIVATSIPEVDLTLTTSDVTFGVTTPVEGTSVPINVKLRNNGGSPSVPFTVAFYATPEGGRETFIGSKFIGNLQPFTVTSTSFTWKPFGFVGNAKVRVVLDPFKRVSEVSETNNAAEKVIVIQSRPDLRISAMTLSDEEPIAGKPVVVQMTIQNTGQTTAPAHTTSLYLGHPSAGGTLIADLSIPTLVGGASTTASYTWTPTTYGSYRLVGRADRAVAVAESDETNNDVERMLYVGLRSPISLDSGASNEPAYSTAHGYGVVDIAPADALRNCGTTVNQTYRRDPAGKVAYRFDHLQPGHFYHLDLVLYDCGTGIARHQYIKVDGITIAEPIDVSAGVVRPVSLLLDPALYNDRSIDVTVEEYEGNGAVVNAIALYDIDYRYADAGGAAQADPPYTVERGRGWLDGTEITVWGTLPYQTARTNQDGTSLRYQFDKLDPAKRYRVNTTFYQGSGSNRVQQLRIDTQNVGASFTIASGQPPYNTSVVVPPGSYTGDRSIVVHIVRTNGGSPIVNEIVLEEVTQ
jgi:hypothetical protein